MKVRVVLTTLGIAGLLTASTADAQRRRYERDYRSRSEYSTLISTNPLFAIFGIYTGEIEHAVSRSATLGISSSYWSFDDEDNSDEPGDYARYFSADLKLRHYPSAHSFKGFAFAVTGGIALIGQSDYTSTLDDSLNPTVTEVEKNGTAATFGFELGYNWLLGEEERFAVALGLGAKRYLPVGKREMDIEGALPTFRLSVGYAF